MTIWALLKKKRLWVGLAIASGLIVLISHIHFGSLLEWISTAQSWLAGQGEWAIPTFIATYVIAAVFGIPNIVLLLAAGTLFGLTRGVISASIADTLSIAACFVIGQTVGRRWITKAVGEHSRFHKLDKAFARKGWKIVLLTRLSPVLPSNILNYGFSLSCINFWEYLFFSWLGMLPVIFTYVYIGTFGVSILTASQRPDNLVFQAIGLVATLGVMIYATKLAASALKTEDSAKTPSQNPEENPEENPEKSTEEGEEKSPHQSTAKGAEKSPQQSTKKSVANVKRKPWHKLGRKSPRDSRLVVSGKEGVASKVSINR